MDMIESAIVATVLLLIFIAHQMSKAGERAERAVSAMERLTDAFREAVNDAAQDDCDKPDPEEAEYIPPTK